MPVSDDWRHPIRFVASARMPHDIYLACQATGTVSSSVYIQHAVCEALARDLKIPLEELLDALPEPKGNAATLFGAAKRARQPGSAHEEVS